MENNFIPLFSIEILLLAACGNCFQSFHSEKRYTVLVTLPRLWTIPMRSPITLSFPGYTTPPVSASSRMLYSFHHISGLMMDSHQFFQSLSCTGAPKLDTVLQRQPRNGLLLSAPTLLLVQPSAQLVFADSRSCCPPGLSGLFSVLKQCQSSKRITSYSKMQQADCILVLIFITIIIVVVNVHLMQWSRSNMGNPRALPSYQFMCN